MTDLLTTVVVEIAQPVKWGRKSKADWDSTLGSLAIVVLSPVCTILNWIALENFQGSLIETLKAASDAGPVLFIYHNLPQPSTISIIGYAAWLLWQTLLYGYLPGPSCSGQRTPGGHLLTYTANGLMAWSITHLLFLTASVLGILNAAIIARHWEGLLVAANVYGFFLATFAQFKGYWFPSFPSDCKLSGSWIFDFWAGVELNPRLGSYLDFKFFHNGRPGMVAWTLINISWAAYQYQKLGYVTKSMLVVLILQTIYVVDFFFNEDWYTRTVDITHDHFGFMLAWGDTTFLPTFYTLQAQYLARYPTHLSSMQTLGLLAAGLAGYAMFRSANDQRNAVRAQNGNARIWGKPATFIRCEYHTADGKKHNSLLLTSGWWGVARHANYFADLLQAWAMCATCGFKAFLPWSYFFFMCVFLYHRAGRDERRCRNKYGKKWEEYCAAVPYRVIPGIY